MKRIAIVTIVMFFLSAMAAHAQTLNEISTVSPVSLSIGMNLDGTRSLSLGLSGTKAGNFEQVIDAEKAARKCVEYLFTCLTLPNDRFWVDLKPGEPGSVSDSLLSRTDFGKILLAADLRLKKDTSALTNPKTPTGKIYWERLYRKAGELGITGPLPACNRVWVVPGDVSTDERSDGITIANSGLRVFVKPDGMPASPDQRMVQLQEYAGAQMQELIVPTLEKKVNESYAYWELRQVFRVLVLARWYKQAAGQTELPAENLTALDTDYAYGVNDIYNDYLDSLKKGEYSVSETSNKLDVFLHLITRHYASGGIDFRGEVNRQRADARRAQDEGMVRFSCTFAASGGTQSLSLAKRSMRLVFPWSHGITADLFARLPAPGKSGFGKLVEKVISSGKIFLNNL
jgi:hypothetical protein